MTDHLTEDRLNDYVDDLLPESERADVAAHIRGCPSCADDVRREEALLTRLSALPQELPIEVDLRPAIRGRLGLHPAAFQRVNRRSALWTLRYPLAAAALLLVVISASSTLWLVRGSGDARTAREPDAATAPAEARASLAEFRVLESEYYGAVEELQRVLNEQRDVLDPTTVRLLDQNLSVIDSALEESRAALQADPNSPILKQMLLSTYRQKVDLLRRAAELGTTS